MTTVDNATRSTQLPTGGCNYTFPNLKKDTTCGCQRFSLRRKPHNGIGSSSVPEASGEGGAVALARAEGGGGGSGVGKEGGDDDDDDENPCRCGHDACFHSDHPPTSLPVREDTTEMQRISYGSITGRKLSVSTQANDPAITHALAHTASLSAISGTVSECDSAMAGTPMVLPRVPWTTRAASKALDGPSRQLPDVVPYRLEDRHQMSPVRLERPPSISSKNPKNEQITMQELHERIEVVEVLPAAVEDLEEKFEMIHDHVNETVDGAETRLKTEIDDRLGPIESFFRARQIQGEKRKRQQLSGPSENCENLSGGQDDKKRRKDCKKSQGPSEAVNQSRGVTTTSFTTTSFTTTTSSFSSQAAINREQPVYEVLRAELETLKAEHELLKTRLLDVESSGAPSLSRPWTVEVVLIPAAPLKGIWAEAGTSVPNTQHTGSEAAYASLPALGRRNSSTSQSSGLVPLSFSQSSMVYKRLLSRGFIRQLDIVGPTAREVSLSVEKSFQDIFEFCSSFAAKSRASSRARSLVRSQESNSSSFSSSQRTARGDTRNLWEPLRKIYMQSALEYLEISDIATPALWTVDFLKANCMMHGSTRNPLYILPRTAGHSIMSSLTWDDIKQLDRFDDPYAQTQLGSAAEGEEPFWAFNPKFDERPSQDLNTGSFFSEPISSIGSFAPESQNDVRSPVRLSFSSYVGSPKPQQEATPPATVPQLQPRRSSNLNRAHAPPPVEDDTDRDITTEEDATENLNPPRKKSSKTLVQHLSISPPSPPLTYPATQRRRKKAPIELDARRNRAGSRSPTAEDSTFATATMRRSGMSLGEMTNMGVGGWQDDSIGGISHHDWEVDNDVGMGGWGSLIESFDEEAFLRDMEVSKDQDQLEFSKVESEEAEEAAISSPQMPNAQQPLALTDSPSFPRNLRSTKKKVKETKDTMKK
ncbi:hypothetical protein FN846DRAFT_902175 [Sphaerosporella brunnea]|uniref:Uncharacterized protein n=1 Tax=Sphaerosporella brunnea TaxID=1250544 RepID=A0A5J5FAS4_9PEZI|nr:hypothetical protein FN846DRAFT_902175 [Sphaerosporella brunnea]